MEVILICMQDFCCFVQMDTLIFCNSLGQMGTLTREKNLYTVDSRYLDFGYLE